MVTAENPASHTYEVANGINTRKALLLTSGYSSLILFRKVPKSEYEDNFIHSEESDEMSINCFSFVVVSSCKIITCFIN